MRLLILDRDGVINEDSPDYVRSVEQWRALPGSIEAIAALSRADFEVVVASNQSGLARGYFSLEDLEAMHEKMCGLVEAAGGRIGGVFYCPHHPDEGCGCRKPRTGLLEAIAREYGVSVAGSFFVGDSTKDVDCALAAGAIPLLVLTGNGRATQAALLERGETVRVFADLAAVARELLDAA